MSTIHAPSSKKTPQGVVLGRDGQPVRGRRKPVIIDLEEARRQYEAQLRAKREHERQMVEKASESVPQRYALMPGRVLIRARPVETAWDANGLFAMTEDRIEMMKAHEPWGTILMVGGEFYTDHGQLMQPDPEWKAGRLVMFNPAGATDLELPVPGEENEKMELLLVGFRAILLVDRGETVVDTAANEIEGGAV